MVCKFLLYNKVNQPYIYIYPHISSLLRLPPTLPIPPPLGGHKAPRSPIFTLSFRVLEMSDINTLQTFREEESEAL